MQNAYTDETNRYAIALKPIFEGVTVSNNLLGAGNVIFSPSVHEKYYFNYFNLGFKLLFDVYDLKEERYLNDDEIAKLKL